MAKHRRMSRKHKSRRHSKKSRRHSKKVSRTQRRQRKQQRGGVAPTNYSLAGSWASNMSLGQGNDYASYHKAQHGGSAPYPVAVNGSPLISSQMEGPAMMGGLTRAFSDIAGLTDQPVPKMQVGAGRKRRHHKKSKSHRHTKKTRRHTKKTRRMRGGAALGFAPIGANPMLLNNAEYSRAGLNPDFVSGGVEAKMAGLRDRV